MESLYKQTKSLIKTHYQRLYKDFEKEFLQEFEFLKRFQGDSLQMNMIGDYQSFQDDFEKS